MDALARCLSVVLVEEEPLSCEALAEALERRGATVLRRHTSLASFLGGLGGVSPEVFLFGRLSGVKPEELLETVRTRHPEAKALSLLDGIDPNVLGRCLSAGATRCVDRQRVTVTALMEALSSARGGLCVPGPGEVAFRSRHAAERPPLIGRLSPRERHVLGHVAEAATNAQIALVLGITERTVKAHVCALYRKLGAKSRPELCLMAWHLGVRAARPS